MRVVIVGYIYPPEVQSMGVMAQELAEDLVAMGHKVTVITGWPNHPRGVLFPGWHLRFRHAEKSPHGFWVLRCGHVIHPRTHMFWRIWHYLTFAISSFVNGLACGRVDSVVCMSTPIFGTWASWLLAKCKRASFVYEIDDLHPETARNAGVMSEGMQFRILRKLDTALCRRSDAIVTLSDHLKRLIVQRQVSGDLVKIIPFWIDTEKIRPGSRMNEWRRRQEIPGDTFVALYAGTIGLVSGAEILTEVACHLADRPDILLLVVGEGVAKDSLEQAAGRQGLRNIRFLPFQPFEDLDDMQATADVGLVTLKPETGMSSIPSKVLGYLAAGRAVVASVAEESGTHAMIQKGQCGVCVPCQDPEAMAAAIRHAADHAAEAREMGRRGREYLVRTFDRKRCTKAYEAVLAPSRRTKVRTEN